MRASSASTPRFSVRLSELALRRTLAPGALLWTAVLAVILATNDWSTDVIALDAGDDSAVAAVSGGLARQGLWSGFCLALMPMVVIRAAAVVGRWRSKGEVDWLGSRAAGRLTIATSTTCGVVLGAWILVLAWWVLVAACAPRVDGSFQLAGSIPAPGAMWVDGAHVRTWSVELPPSARELSLAAPELPSAARLGRARVRIELGLGAGAGPATEVVLRARSHGEVTTARTHIGTRGTIEVALPAGADAVELELSVSDPDARVLVLSDAAQVWIPVASAGAADRAIVLRLCVASCAWIALAFGFGAWISAASAALCVFALWIAAWLADAPCPWIPGIDLPEALAIAAQGRVPPELDPRAYVGAIVALASGLALAASGLARWRRAT